MILIFAQGSHKKSIFFSEQSTKAGNGFFPRNFWTKRVIFLGKYLKKPVKDCEFFDGQLIHNTLIH